MLKLNYDYLGPRENYCRYTCGFDVDIEAKRQVNAPEMLALFREAIPSLVTDVVVTVSRDPCPPVKVNYKLRGC